MLYSVLQNDTIPYHSVVVPPSHTYSFRFVQLCRAIRSCNSALYCVVLYLLLSFYTLLYLSTSFLCLYIYIYQLLSLVCNFEHPCQCLFFLPTSPHHTVTISHPYLTRTTLTHIPSPIPPTPPIFLIPLMPQKHHRRLTPGYTALTSPSILLLLPTTNSPTT